jgi:hypothetical protein
MRTPCVSALPLKNAVLALALFCSVAASGQGFLKKPEVSIFAGYSLERYDSVPLGFSDKLNLNGGNVEVALSNLYQGLGIAADFSGHWNDQLKTLNFLIGPQYKFEVKGITPFGHLLIGKSRTRLLQLGTSLLQPSSLGGTVALGGGLDIPLGNRFAVRAIQADYLINSIYGDRRHDVRYSSGLVVTFGKTSSPPSF